MSTTWINCSIKFTIPSEEALNLVAQTDPKKKEVPNLGGIEKFLANNLGKDFHKKYQTFTDPKS